MGIMDLFRGKPAVSEGVRPKASYFKNERNIFFKAWNPVLRETSEDVQAAWQKSAARALDAIHNSGFIAGGVEVSTGSVVGSGLRMSARPDGDSLKWSNKEANDWARSVESAFQTWSGNALECDAGARLTFGMQQQVAYASWLAYGEALAITPVFVRDGRNWANKVLMIPPSRLVNKNDGAKLIQGVRCDAYGAPVSYIMNEKDTFSMLREIEVAAYDADGRPNVIHQFEPSMAATRGISPLATVLKVVRQVDQYCDANLTSALIQTIFAATIRTDISGLSAFEGLMTDQDTGTTSNGILNLDQYAAAKGEWYDGAKIDLQQHGRIAHLFPNDHLEFTEAKTPGQQFDHFMGWLLREIARGLGVTYEGLTGDYRGATYSSIRMAGAMEWQTVKRRRDNIVVPFCQRVYENWLDEAIATGRVGFPGGYEAYRANRAAASMANWTGPARPQADDYKTAKAFEVLKGMHATTLAEIADEYGRDWDDDMRQRAREKEYAAELGLPDPWAPKDIMSVDGGPDAAVEAEKNAGLPPAGPGGA